MQTGDMGEYRGFQGKQLYFNVLGLSSSAAVGLPHPLAAINVAVPDVNLFHWHPFLAPFHAVFLHLPIGFVMMAAILEIYRTWHSAEELKRVVRLALWLSLASGIVTAALGMLRAGNGEYDPRAVEWHRWAGLAVPVCTLITLVLQKRAFRSARTCPMLSYRVILTGTLALLMVAGHLGGNLTHGAGYLVENAPAFVRDWIGHPHAAAIPEMSRNEQQQFFISKVAPILQAKCSHCHGPEKHKGGYRLDQVEIAMKGGDSGKPAIKAGDVPGSNLARLILLPPDHDDVMPPSGKEPLTLGELMDIVHWIRMGAAFPSTP
ncbi:MAG: c-type cytochrome domain-containing protein [Verrucomicrobiota bacterium]